MLRGERESGSPVVWSWPRTRGRQRWLGERKKRKNIRGGGGCGGCLEKR